MNQTFTKNEIDVLAFHFPCQDGLSSAAVARLYYKKSNLNNLIFLPVQHNKKIVCDFTDCNVLFIDFCPPDADIENILSANNRIYILDHHITAKERLNDCPYAKFDMNKSGVGLAWEYFFPEEPMPEFVSMIQERDLWRFSNPNTQDFTLGFSFDCASTDSLDESFKLFDKLFVDPLQTKYYIDLGKVLNQNKNAKIKRIVSNIKDNVYNYGSNRVCMYNCDHELASDLGNALCKDNHCDFAVLWRYDHLTEEYHISLRSANKVNCANLAKEILGGGGHPNAAGGASKIHPSVLFSQISDII
jgi:oligoribonuclease NrnB/cAMP/cGMP phosphodiesterase (DHH superfamily)